MAHRGGLTVKVLFAFVGRCPQLLDELYYAGPRVVSTTGSLRVGWCDQNGRRSWIHGDLVLMSADSTAQVEFVAGEDGLVSMEVD